MKLIKKISAIDCGGHGALIDHPVAGCCNDWLRIRRRQQEIVDKASLVSQKGSLFGFSFGTVGCRRDINVEMRMDYCRRKAEQIGYGLGNVSDYGIYMGRRYGPSSSPIFWWNTLVGTLLIKPSWCIRTSFIF